MKYLSRLINRLKWRDSPLDELIEIHDLIVFAARRCAYDLKHCANEIEKESSVDYLARQKMWIEIFSPGGDKEYRHSLHREISGLNFKIDQYEDYFKKNKIENPFERQVFQVKFNPINGMPNWLAEGRDISHTSIKNRKHYIRSLRYYRKLYAATPSWYDESHHKKILSIYKDCAKYNRFNPKKFAVDHIVPICSDFVCGLNVPWNYQIITAKENAKKSNLYWPGMAFEQIPLDLPKVDNQLRLFP